MSEGWACGSAVLGFAFFAVGALGAGAGGGGFEALTEFAGGHHAGFDAFQFVVQPLESHGLGDFAGLDGRADPKQGIDAGDAVFRPFRVAHDDGGVAQFQIEPLLGWIFNELGATGGEKTTGLARLIEQDHLKVREASVVGFLADVDDEVVDLIDDGIGGEQGLRVSGGHAGRQTGQFGLGARGEVEVDPEAGGGAEAGQREDGRAEAGEAGTSHAQRQQLVVGREPAEDE